MGRAGQARFFAGLTIDEAAATPGHSRATAYRHWDYARAWLRAEVRNSDGPVRE